MPKQGSLYLTPHFYSERGQLGPGEPEDKGREAEGVGPGPPSRPSQVTWTLIE